MRPPERPSPRPSRPAGPAGATLPRAVRLELERGTRGPSTEAALTWMERALKARERGKARDAYRAAVRAKEAAPRSTAVREIVGLSAFELGEYQEASRELLTYRRLSGERRHDPLIADCYRKLGKHARALEFLGELTLESTGEATWARGQIARAEVLHELGRTAEGLAVLVAGQRRVKTDRARRYLEAGRRALAERSS